MAIRLFFEGTTYFIHWIGSSSPSQKYKGDNSQNRGCQCKNHQMFSYALPFEPLVQQEGDEAERSWSFVQHDGQKYDEFNVHLNEKQNRYEGRDMGVSFTFIQLFCTLYCQVRSIPDV